MSVIPGDVRSSNYLQSKRGLLMLQIRAPRVPVLAWTWLLVDTWTNLRAHTSWVLCVFHLNLLRRSKWNVHRICACIHMNLILRTNKFTIAQHPFHNPHLHCLLLLGCYCCWAAACSCRIYNYAQRDPDSFYMYIFCAGIPYRFHAQILLPTHRVAIELSELPPPCVCLRLNYMEYYCGKWKL